MPVAKEQIRQIISENNLSSVADVYALLNGLMSISWLCHSETVKRE
ncbi:MAG: hypothetical protein HFI70_15340 [Lachnospiraceae bacterium]|nr:hypothetical protein [Lachnospiraceae bacterium]